MENAFSTIDIIVAIACIAVVLLVYIFYRVYLSRETDRTKDANEYPPKKKRRK